MMSLNDAVDLARSTSTALAIDPSVSRRNDLNSAYRVEVGRAYAEWFGIQEAARYLECHSVDSSIIDRVLKSRLFRGCKP